MELDNRGWKKIDEGMSMTQKSRKLTVPPIEKLENRGNERCIIQVPPMSPLPGFYPNLSAANSTDANGSTTTAAATTTVVVAAAPPKPFPPEPSPPQLQIGKLEGHNVM